MFYRVQAGRRQYSLCLRELPRPSHFLGEQASHTPGRLHMEALQTLQRRGRQNPRFAPEKKDRLHGSLVEHAANVGGRVLRSQNA